MRNKDLKYGILLMLFAFAGIQVSAQSTKNLVRKGNKLFEQQKYQDAEVKYRKALEKKPDYTKGQFNLGDAVYREKNYKEAGKIFSNLAQTAKIDQQKAHSLYNLGNSLMQQKQYAKSINAYIQSLKLNPDDADAKYNLTYARKMLKKQQQKKKQQHKNNKNNKKNKKQQQKNKQNKKDQKKKNQQNKKNQQKQQPKNQQSNQKKGKQQNQRHQISRQDAKRILDALKNNEKKTLHKLQKQKAKAVHAKPNVINW